MFGVVSRLSWQKGLDLLLECLPLLDECNAQLALLGSGDPALEAAFRDAAQHHRGRIGAHFGYEEKLAHLIQAGADALVIPSRFEPCGLTQLCAMRYGAVPVVARVGGLADTIIDANEMAVQSGCATGLQFAPVSVDGLAGAHAKSRRAVRAQDAVAQASDQWHENGRQLDASGAPLRPYLPRDCPRRRRGCRVRRRP